MTQPPTPPAAGSSGLVRATTPEERELARKLLELSQLEEQLADRELALATLSVEVRAFEILYARTVGIRLAELDEIEADIAEAWARKHPDDDRAGERAHRSRERFESSSRAAAAAASTKSPTSPEPQLRSLYREAARQIHPDLAADDESRTLRTKLMAEANRAYAASDEDALRALLRNWAGRPESIVGDSVSAQLVWAIRKIDRVRTRLTTLAQETEQLHASEAVQLMTRVNDARGRGRNLLDEMAARVASQVAVARKRRQAMDVP